MKTSKYLSLCLVIIGLFQAKAQNEQRPIITGVPFLLIPADARASGMGDMGVATPVDVYSQQWNPAKYAFSENKQGIGFGYTPYLRELADDINLGTLTYYNRINERGSFSASLRYFGLGEVNLRQTAEDIGRPVEPNEFAVDLSYSLRLSETFAMSVTGKYIRSDFRIPSGLGSAQAANSFAAGIHGFYRSKEKFYDNINMAGRWRAGFAIDNIGPKISYDDGGFDNFIPTMFRAGGGFDFIFDTSNRLGVYVEANKLLVPTPPEFPETSSPPTPEEQAEIERLRQDYLSQNEYAAIFTSWTSAPDGFSETFREITWSIATEYWYEDAFALRAGYFYEHPEKGFRQYATIGFGFKYTSVVIDASYLFSTAQGVQNPLEGTLRFSISFNLGENRYVEF
ncbi:type IX secretion system outer membrane channel protein PorV [Psychroflexus maritimus]|uniref:Type IX secretion system outer membrane channel protein PorV n=1 Tax=Psychroflexus maritimus TaxID=2714865 RepID=A0A967ADN3_9FLAO|nr:type IX secretion system outer membrane channel protein PorV [Psychroflexus maritimus]NGZ89368.1 type IX secretion system outer membrane channel protein PorV [Psychroflexus maritimus]